MLVHEIFEAFQGEGFWVGTPSIFLRLYGCNVQCPFCDTLSAKQTGRAQGKFSNYPVNKLGAQLLESSAKMQIPFITITGGEPLDQADELMELISWIKREKSGIQLQLETSGISEHAEVFAARAGLLQALWITLSPKPHRPSNPTLFKRAHELKVLVGSTDKSVAWAKDLVSAASPITKLRFQPLISKEHNYKESLKNCYELSREFGGRVSLQVHKFVGWR